MGKCVRTDIRHSCLKRNVRNLSNPLCNRREHFNIFCRNTFVSHFYLKVTAYRRKVRVSCPLAESEKHALHMRCASLNCKTRVCNGKPAVIVRVYSYGTYFAELSDNSG